MTSRPLKYNERWIARLLDEAEIALLAEDQKKAYMEPPNMNENYYIGLDGKSEPPLMIIREEKPHWWKDIILGYVNANPGQTLEEREHAIAALKVSLELSLRTLDPLQIMKADGFALLLIPKSLLDNINAAYQDHAGA